jgi:hypothetical protein
MNKSLLTSIALYAFLYAVILTVWSMAFNALRGQSFSWVFGFLIVAIMYYYLKYALQQLTLNNLNKAHLIICGALITLVGCIASTTFLWHYNAYQGLQNSIAKSIQSSVVNGVFGLAISAILAGKLKPGTPK